MDFKKFENEANTPPNSSQAPPKNSRGAKNKKEASITLAQALDKTVAWLRKDGFSRDKYSGAYYLGNVLLNKAQLNSLLFHCRGLFGIRKDDFNTIIDSTQVLERDCIDILKKECEALTEQSEGAIVRLFDTLVLECSEHKQVLLSIFTKWLIGFWAQLLGEKHNDKNDIMLVLCGANNLGKSFFFKELFEAVGLPTAILDKVANDKIDDLKRFASEAFCVLFDDVPQSVFQNDDIFKNVLSTKQVSLIPKYSNFVQNKPRTASFCATSNYNDIIYNDAYNRRIVPISIIDRDKEGYDAINKKAVFADAYALYCDNHTHELSAEEVDFIRMVLSKKHKQENFEASLILDIITPCPESQGGKFYTSTELYGLFFTLKFALNSFGKELKKCGFEKVQKRVTGFNSPKTGYWVKIKE